MTPRREYAAERSWAFQDKIARDEGGRLRASGAPQRQHEHAATTDTFTSAAPTTMGTIPIHAAAAENDHELPPKCAAE